MNALKVLIDTDVLIDFLTDRGSLTKTAKEIMKKTQENEIHAFLAAHSITNIFYILRKIYLTSERKQRLLNLCRFISIVEIGQTSLLKVLLNDNFNDIEDCLQAECAKAINADYIVTRNVKDYVHSSIPAVLPKDLLKII